ncbi:hypothetical protein [Prescottella equi]|uniref:Uncharacterized protein n=1 Tax=Rhodococcus hoagii (strain 103S) TaxID=685727 RepID=A0A3S5YD49_RHOH1|nr:hypothetical protein [Prescottella equi]ERN43374.1 hypothetical protein H849_22857 [Prescottella equi NBRC 101255 = C 7]WJJ11992.1 hypothetical protein P9990_01270 [Prescottella equi]WQB73246.1 hypothetical protein SCD75_15770 [Prescottella equi]CBH50432.1 hypothetical protein REQ_44710 [Prescottella equi 103S]SUE01907.1 Uncharacterised protein [Prescottella equi]
MSVSFLNATAVLVRGLLDDVWGGSWMPGVEGLTGSLAGLLEMS